MTIINNNALDLLQKRYFRKDETKWEHLCDRVALSVALAEENHELRQKYYEEFYEAMSNLEMIPSTPCLINANTEGTGQLSSCFIIELRDNIESIYKAKSDCARIFQKNGGLN